MYVYRNHKRMHFGVTIATRVFVALSVCLSVSLSSVTLLRPV